MKAQTWSAFTLATITVVLIAAGGRSAVALPAEEAAIGPKTFSCADVTEIPQAECNALVALYDGTNGPGWTRKGGWKDTNAPCSWYGVMCREGHVSHLRLGANNLSGAIPSALANLTKLQDLLLYSNQLTGPIPSWLGNLTVLARFSAYSNSLSGEIPPELGNLSNLWYLWLDRNQLSGSIPPQLGNLVNLRELSLWSNQLSGSIPAEFGNLINVQVLSLGINQLSGSIPPTLGNLINVKRLTLSSNQFSGSIPAQLGSLAALESLTLGSNQLSGTVPPELGNLSKLVALSLDNTQLSGALPQSLTGLSLTTFWFDNTNLCEPGDAAFQAWLGTIANSRRTAVCADVNGFISPDMGGTLTYTGPLGSRVTIAAPPHAVTETMYLAYTGAAPPAAPPSCAFAGVAFGLEAYRNGVHWPGFAFQEPITLTVAYTDAQIGGLDESSLTLDYETESGWVDAATTCTPVSVYARNPAENLLTLNICHLSSYALFACENPMLNYRVYLPLALRA